MGHWEKMKLDAKACPTLSLPLSIVFSLLTLAYTHAHIFPASQGYQSGVARASLTFLVRHTSYGIFVCLLRTCGGTIAATCC